jgi:uncharacterized protein (DUF2147 family)
MKRYQNKNKFILIVICISFFLCQQAKSQSQDNFIGFWENDEKTINIEIYKLEDSYYGKLIKASSLKFRKQVGSNILIQMKKESDEVLFGGTFFDFEHNKEYEVKLKLIDKNHFYLKRYFRFLNKRHYWNRVEN